MNHTHLARLEEIAALKKSAALAKLQILLGRYHDIERQILQLNHEIAHPPQCSIVSIEAQNHEHWLLWQVSKRRELEASLDELITPIKLAKQKAGLAVGRADVVSNLSQNQRKHSRLQRQRRQV